MPELHFGAIRRGKVDEDTPRFSGRREELDGFIPKKFTRKMAVSKVVSVWDLLGKYAPIMGGLKFDIRKTSARPLLLVTQ